MKLILTAQERDDLFENFLDAYTGDLTVAVAFSAYDDMMQHKYEYEFPSKRSESADSPYEDLEIVFTPET